MRGPFATPDSQSAVVPSPEGTADARSVSLTPWLQPGARTHSRTQNCFNSFPSAILDPPSSPLSGFGLRISFGFRLVGFRISGPGGLRFFAANPMSAPQKYVDFGAPDKFGAHLFRVEIPAVRTEPVRIVEDFGYRGLEGGIPRDEDRAILSRPVWSGIADIARREFNDRLKTAKVTTGRWHTGTNLVDRLLGKELCVLAWAAESANDDQLPVICSKWAALRPEERWWLFSMTVAEAGLPEDTQRGWRRALFLALSDGEKPPEGRKRRRPVESDLFSLPLFGSSQGKAKT